VRLDFSAGGRRKPDGGILWHSFGLKVDPRLEVMNGSVGQPEANGQNHGAAVVFDPCRHGTRERVWEFFSQRPVNKVFIIENKNLSEVMDK
jgi:hypothetical protein